MKGESLKGENLKGEKTKGESLKGEKAKVLTSAPSYTSYRSYTQNQAPPRNRTTKIGHRSTRRANKNRER